ncbi:EAL domain-containing protein [Shewanella sp. 10N.286.48.A6]|uniref:EAL domain-containing response regulator n=1 Tax=Shewanella sp. 10N.286.48.A6 TaxID=1880833 RepID=UPI000C854260|nr:EAL domain-containing response regulator [Shewanella sp. 10N.286.48.A6]PMH94709.1 hypothetical protein BCU55_19775 [Shewanella sp. 10N.286.48.A6]
MKKHINSILVVDDQPIVRRIFTRSLEQLGTYEIIEAADGLEAFNLIKQKHFDLIFCDLNMPVKDGLYLLQRLIEIQYTSAIVLFSGEGETLLNSAKVLATYYHLNILGVVRKPITATMLSEFLVKATNADSMPQTQVIATLTSKQLEYHLNKGNVRAYLQPQYNLDTMQICGFEALARIVDGDKVISPSQFIHAAEENKFILRITKAVVEDAIKNFAKLDVKYRSLSLSINISGKVLDEEDLPFWLEEVTSKNKISCSSITCELTETAIPSNPSVMIVALLRLRMMKFKLSIDDFGTGFASLEQLHMLPFHELKIDRCFVENIVTNTKSQALFTRSILLANDLKMTAIAEGVESKETVDVIKKLGCNIAQGFYFCKPFPANKIITVINKEGLDYGVKFQRELTCERT